MGRSLTSDSLRRLSFCIMYFWMDDAGMLPSLSFGNALAIVEII